MTDRTILVVGTYDTKDDELRYIAGRIRAQGGGALTMDVGVLGEPSAPCDISKHRVAEAGGSSIRAAIDSGDENTAMQIMAKGASAEAPREHGRGRRNEPTPSCLKRHRHVSGCSRNDARPRRAAGAERLVEWKVSN